MFMLSRPSWVFVQTMNGASDRWKGKFDYTLRSRDSKSDAYHPTIKYSLILFLDSTNVVSKEPTQLSKAVILNWTQRTGCQSILNIVLIAPLVSEKGYRSDMIELVKTRQMAVFAAQTDHLGRN